MAASTYTVEVSYMYDGTEVKFAGGNRTEAHKVFNDLSKRHADALDVLVEFSVWENGSIVGYTDDTRTPKLERDTILCVVVQ